MIKEKKSEPGGIRVPDFRLYYKPTVNEMVWYYIKKKKRIECPKINPHIYGAPNLLLEIMQKYTMEKGQSLQ